MRLIKQTTLALTACLFIASQAMAGEVTLPNTFSANTPAVADEVNANFTAVKTAVDDNNNRVTDNTAEIVVNTDKISAVIQPLTMGLIYSDASIGNSAGKTFTCVWNDTIKRYEITVEGFSVGPSNFVAVVTPMSGTGENYYGSAGSVSGKLLIKLHNSDDTLRQDRFTFVLYEVK